MPTFSLNDDAVILRYYSTLGATLAPMRHVLLFALLLFAQALSAQTPKADILIRNGRLYDGTGNTWTLGDVAIRAGRIAAVGRLPADYPADTVLDAKGLAVAPGFIDVHTHIEDDEVHQPTADNFIYDGVTTVVTGNCGSSRLPLGAILRCWTAYACR
ncbi:amidohydrolase family protein [Hymenobacter qilianensis]|uniref:amidohydrolase family protein n=1 Tax=Hymenobacter qilianensis TaxID=1385715 RepID=UPI001CB9A7A7|nr:amidohydrolase family protein [Hymenobacter qilianensis]